MKIFLLIAVMALGSGIGCTDECDAGDTRCDGTSLAVCDGDGNWQALLSCAEWGDACCALSDGGADCLPECP
jgi:hypothetical protein